MSRANVIVQCLTRAFLQSSAFLECQVAWTMSDVQTPQPLHEESITAKSVACFAIQVTLNVSMLSMTAFACVVWCVPSSLLLGLVASVEATLAHTMSKYVRARIQHTPAAVPDSQNRGYWFGPDSQAIVSAQVYGLGAPAA